MSRATIRLARQLAASIPEIARRENAGEIFADIKAHVDAIGHMINRPIPPRYCGPCPTHRDYDGKPCGAALLAPREATQVTCHACVKHNAAEPYADRHVKTVHTIAEIEQQLWDDVDEWLLSPHEILMLMAHFGEPVPESTFRRWRATGKLQPRGERNGKPRFWPGDVRRLRNAGKAK